MWSRFALIFVLFFLIVFSCNNTHVAEEIDTPQSPPESRILCDSVTATLKSEWIDSIFTKLSKGYWFNGSVAYLEQGCLIYQKSFGLSNFRTKDTLNTNSAFQLASVSKMFTAMSAMILKEDELLDYDADIKTYLPEFPYEGVTTRMLMTHRAGLSRYMSLAHEQWSDKTIPITNDDMLSLFAEYVPDPYFRPDNGFTKSAYCMSEMASTTQASSA